MKKNEALKKHHFWILAGLAPLFTLVAVLLIVFGVGGEIERVAAENEKELDTVKKTQPKGTQAIDDMEKQKAVLLQKRGELWKANYEKQKELFAWPARFPLIRRMSEKYQKFGEPMADPQDEFNLFKNRENYEASYDQIADSIKPTTFPGGNWRSKPVLRYVSDWGDRKPTSNQIWLALEDLWVQRGLLTPIRNLTAESARFTLQGDEKSAPPLKRTFTSRVWKLDLEVPSAGPAKGRVLEARLTNMTNRLQVLGRNGGSRFRVWLSENAQPIDFTIQGDFVRAGATVEIKQTYGPDGEEFVLADGSKTTRGAAKKSGQLVEVRLNPTPRLHGIPPGTEVSRITRAEQVHDERTVPVRRVENIELGYKDARHHPAALKPPKWWPADAEAGTGGDTGGAGGLGGLGSPDGAGPSGASFGGPPGGVGGRAGAQAAKRGAPSAVLNANKDRYLDTTDQVRRMPVAVVLLVDQLYMQDALVAYANSPMRFQITQVHWKRFRGNLEGLSPSGPGSGYPSGGDMGDDLTLGSGDGMGAAGAGDTGSPDGGDAAGAVGPGGGGRAPGPPPPDAGGGPGMGLPPGGPGLGFPGGMGGFGNYFGGTSTLPETQLTSGLIELTIYGIVTLYEKYEEQPADGSTPTTTPDATTPMPGETGEAAAPMNPANPMNPATGDKKDDTTATPPTGTPKTDDDARKDGASKQPDGTPKQ